MYLDYDNLYVTVKSDRLDELTSYYKYLGWECVEVKEHRIYSDELNACFRRPHGIDHKDERQLMQVYLDEALNGLAKLRARSCPKSTAYCVILSLLGAGLITAGLCIMFILGGDWFLRGFAAALFGGFLAVFTLATSIISFRKEKKSELARAELLRQTIGHVCNEAANLGGGDND